MNTKNSTKICCLILTMPKYFTTRVKAVERTWAPRCDQHYYVSEPLTSSESEETQQFAKTIPLAPLPDIVPGYDHLTKKSMLGFAYTYKQYYNVCDWFIKADDDTYLLVENLRSFLSRQNQSEPVTFGYNFKVIVSGGYHSGGGAYVLSREALYRFHKITETSESKCQKDGGSEDVEIAKCLRNAGVFVGNSLDEFGRERFHPLPFTDHFEGRFADWLYQYAMNALRKGVDCCSDESISFHYVSPENMNMIDFFLNRAKPRSQITTDVIQNNQTNLTKLQRH